MRVARFVRLSLALLALPSLLALTLAGCGADAKTSAIATPTATVSPLALQIDAYFTQQLAAQRFTGAVLVAQGDRVLLSKGYGQADATQAISNTPETQFRIGSITKQFTAAAILLLQARGKLSVADPICRYLSPCPRAWQPITIEELLTHTSGIPDLADNDIADYTKPLSSQQLLALIRAKPLAFAPGARFLYSSAGYNVLGVIVEQVSGESYATFVQQEIFAPLGMTHTRYDASQTQLPAHATGYTTWQTPATYLDMTLPFAAGGLASTVGDLDTWSRALDAHTLLGADGAAAMLTAHVAVCPTSQPTPGLCPSDVTTLGYGYGYFIGAGALGRVEFHAGNILGFTALLARYPDRGLTVVVLSNLESADMVAIQSALEGIAAAGGGPSA